MKIPDPKENPGILPLQLGPTKIQTGTHDFIHDYNLILIAQEIDAIQNQYGAVAIAIHNRLSHSHGTSLQNTNQGLQYQFEAVILKQESIDQ
ncbi:hypothetical protein JTB14_025793 [Gonioctena quinquepunctata]|nr:hypothetical protein JTB14_025793 [Gonioctena quinquepunctata]